MTGRGTPIAPGSPAEEQRSFHPVCAPRSSFSDPSPVYSRSPSPAPDHVPAALPPRPDMPEHPYEYAHPTLPAQHQYPPYFNRDYAPPREYHEPRAEGEYYEQARWEEAQAYDRQPQRPMYRETYYEERLAHDNGSSGAHSPVTPDGQNPGPQNRLPSDGYFYAPSPSAALEAAPLPLYYNYGTSTPSLQQQYSQDGGQYSTGAYGHYTYGATGSTSHQVSHPHPQSSTHLAPSPYPPGNPSRSGSLSDASSSSKPFVNTDDRPFRCDECPHSFHRNHDLKRHKRIHLEVKPYPCNWCEKRFTRKDALKRHLLVKQHPMTPEDVERDRKKQEDKANNKARKSALMARGAVPTAAAIKREAKAQAAAAEQTQQEHPYAEGRANPLITIADDSMPHAHNLRFERPPLQPFKNEDSPNSESSSSISTIASLEAGAPPMLKTLNEGYPHEGNPEFGQPAAPFRHDFAQLQQPLINTVEYVGYA